MYDLNFYWKKIIELKKGERVGNHRGIIFHNGDYMLLEAEEGAKKLRVWMRLDSCRAFIHSRESGKYAPIFSGR